jgi:LysM repeat protein
MMDIKHILEKLSEIDTKHTLLESAPTSVTPKPVVDTAPSMSFRSVYEQLVSEVLSERVTINPDGTTSGGLRPQPAASAPGAGIPNPPPNLNVAAPTPLTTGDGKPVGSGTPGVNWNEQPKPADPAAPASDWKGQTDEFGGMEEKPAVATTSPVTPPAVSTPVAPQTAPSAVTSSPAAADPAAPAVTANPTTAPAVAANPAVTPAKTPYKGSAGSQEIQKLNPAIKDVNKIQVGQTLKMPDGSTYTVKPGDTLDKIAKGAKPAEATKMPPPKGFDRFDKAPQAATPPAAKPAPAPAAPAAPFKKELDQKDLDRIKQLSGAPTKPGKVDLSVNNPAMNPVNNAPGAPAPGGTTTTRTNQSVTGTMKMGKPDGPITFNGKVVNPGQPEYAAASQALIQSQQKATNFRSRNDQNVEKTLAASGAPVSAGAPNVDRADFESIRNEDDAILERIRSALKF